MIEAYQYSLNDATPENSCSWIAECEIEGVHYEARSRRGAPHELARVLVAAGIADDVLRVRSLGLRGWADYRSFHAAARRTIKENASTGPRSVRWEPAPAEWPVKLSGKAKDGGEAGDKASLPISPSSPPVSASPHTGARESPIETLEE